MAEGQNTHRDVTGDAHDFTQRLVCGVVPDGKTVMSIARSHVV
jgi:hypothetical protein